MVSKGRRLDTDLRRKAPSRSPKRRILIVCEGEKTEPLYFKAFQYDVHNPRVHVEVSRETGDPRAAVQIAVRLRKGAEAEAARLRDENIQWDDVWAVFDVDQHDHLDEARALAAGESIQLAISNPCFELWGLLHFEDQRSHITGHHVQARLSRFLGSADKALDYSRMRGGYTEAVRRATELDAIASRSESPGANLTTGVYHLTEQIRIGR